MPWVRIDEDFYLHPKVRKAGTDAMALHVAALCYCNHYLTDGYLPSTVLPSLLLFEHGQQPEDVARRLVEAGMWEKAPGGYVIHDYLDYQPSRAEALAERERKKRAGSRGGQARAQAQSKQTLKQNSSTLLANGQAEGQAKLKPVPVPVPYIEEDDEETRAREDDEETPTQAIISGWQQGTKESGKNASAGCLVLDLLLERAEEGWEPDLLRELARESATKNMPRRWAETVLPNLAHANVRTLADYRSRLARSHNRGAPRASQTEYPDLTERYRDVLGGR